VTAAVMAELAIVVGYLPLPSLTTLPTNNLKNLIF